MSEMGERWSVIRTKVRRPQVHAFERDRVHRVLGAVWNYRLGLVTGPAGSGKTTALAQFTTRTDHPVAWYRAETSDGSVPALLGHLERALGEALGGLDSGWSQVEDAISALERWPGERALLVIDDLHTIRGTKAEAALERFVNCMPPTLTILAASRTLPEFNLSRLRVSGDLLEIGPDPLRFRSWEVEGLFRDFYAEPLPPEDLAELTRRTQGWAAGLQLFHLATRDKPATKRRRTLADLATRSKLVREYLTQNMLDDLPDELRSFLLDTCVLGLLTGPLCDRLRGASGSERLLAELERRQIFTSAYEDVDGYRYHEILRLHLEAMLVEQIGEANTRRRREQAGRLLEEAGAAADALRAYCHAEDWVSVGRLLGREGEQLARDASRWMDAIPPAFLHDDPWVQLAMARRLFGRGEFQDAVKTYERAEKLFGNASAAAIPHRERQALSIWLEAASVAPDSWMALARTAILQWPPTEDHEAATSTRCRSRFAAGLAFLLAGEVRQAQALLTAESERQDASSLLTIAAMLTAGIAGLLAHDPRAVDQVEASIESCERLDYSWLARIGLAALALDRRAAVEDAFTVRNACEASGDRWGAALATLFAGLGAFVANLGKSNLLDSAADQFRALGAPVLEAWARAAHAMALAGEGSPEALASASAAESLAHATQARGPLAYAFAAYAAIDEGRAGEYAALAATLCDQTGLTLPEPDESGSLPSEPVEGSLPAASGPAVALRCFGAFRLAIDGQPVNPSAVKPKVRSVLHLLAARAGQPVHRDMLVDAVWPDADSRAGTRRLHVALSSLRQLLEPGVARGASSLLIREGDTYRLAISEKDVDVLRFERALREARRAKTVGDPRRVADWLGRALEAYGGELLPEVGAAEWVLEERDRCRAAAADAAGALGQILLERGDEVEAAQVCERGLGIDRYRDGLWRLLIAARGRSGDKAAAARARRSYEAVLGELGVTSPGRAGDSEVPAGPA